MSHQHLRGAQKKHQSVSSLFSSAFLGTDRGCRRVVPRWVAVQAEMVERTWRSLEPGWTARPAEAGPWSYPSGYRVMTPGHDTRQAMGPDNEDRQGFCPVHSLSGMQQGLWVLGWLLGHGSVTSECQSDKGKGVYTRGTSL